MSYQRVIPRDLFNEAKLLKCMGQLALLVHDDVMQEGLNIEINYNGDAYDYDYDEGFCVYQDPNSGNIGVGNLAVRINNERYIFETRHNSKDNYPLECTVDGYECIQVLNEQGQFDQEFIDHFTANNNENL